MWESANAVLSGLILFASIVVGICLAIVSLVLAAGSLRFSSGGDAVFPPFPIPILGEDTRLVLRLLQVMLPYLLLVCVAALCMGLLNARGYFFIPAMSATMLNVVLIAAVLLLAPRFGDQLENPGLLRWRSASWPRGWRSWVSNGRRCARTAFGTAGSGPGTTRRCVRLCVGCCRRRWGLRHFS